MNTRISKNILLIALIAVMTFSLSGCVSISGFDLFGRSVRGSGNAAQEERTVSGFDEVTLDGIGMLEITTGDAVSLTIEADDNLLPYITTEVRSGRLIIGVRDGINLRPDQPIEYHLTIDDPGLERVELNGSGEIFAERLTQPELGLEINGSGDIRIDRVEAEQLTVRLDGSGDFFLEGQVSDQSVDINGSGNYEAGSLQTDQTTISIDGSGNVTVWSEGQLEINISGSGSVSYYGSPDINQRTSGSGDIHNLGER